MKDFVEGSIVPGKVLEVRSNEVLVDIGYKSEGVIPAHEFADITAVKPGDSLSVLLSRLRTTMAWLFSARSAPTSSSAGKACCTSTRKAAWPRASSSACAAA